MIKRDIQKNIQQVLDSGKSILLLGPRQTGKSTLINQSVAVDIEYSFLLNNIRQRFEANPDLLLKEISGLKLTNPKLNNKLPIVFIDEVQLIPEILDVAQYMIDKNIAQFILTGSSARKLLKRKSGVNLLPGRVINIRMDSLSIHELKKQNIPLEELLFNGSMPEIITQRSVINTEALLASYVETYLEQEVRAEALVRNLGSFSQFLKVAAQEAGKTLNISNISNDLGIKRHLFEEYMQVLEDCLIIEKIYPLTFTTQKRKLTKSIKYLFFDLGLRRMISAEGKNNSQESLGHLFEQFIGMELINILRNHLPKATLHFWRDHAGPEIDYVIQVNNRFIPIEVKYKTNPKETDARHLKKFIAEYECLSPALIVCQAQTPLEVCDGILAISWQNLPEIIGSLLNKSKASTGSPPSRG